MTSGMDESLACKRTVEREERNRDDGQHSRNRTRCIPAAEMRGHWEGDEDVMHDKSDDQGKQAKAPKNQVDGKPDDNRSEQSHPEVIATDIRDGTEEDDYDGRDTVLPYQQPC